MTTNQTLAMMKDANLSCHTTMQTVHRHIKSALGFPLFCTRSSLETIHEDAPSPQIEMKPYQKDADSKPEVIVVTKYEIEDILSKQMSRELENTLKTKAVRYNSNTHPIYGYKLINDSDVKGVAALIGTDNGAGSSQ